MQFTNEKKIEKKILKNCFPFYLFVCSNFIYMFKETMYCSQLNFNLKFL